MSASSTHVPGMVGVLSASEAVSFSSFASDLDGLVLPQGTVKHFVSNPDVSWACNEVVALARERGLGWVWLIGSSRSFAPDTIVTLLARDAEIIGPVVLEPAAPFRPEATPFRLDEVTGPGTLHEVDQITSPMGVLIRRSAFELGLPVFDEDGMAGFCERAAARGVQSYVDTSVRLGHRFVATIRPEHRAGRWELVASVGGIEFTLPVTSKAVEPALR